MTIPTVDTIGGSLNYQDVPEPEGAPAIVWATDS